MASLAPASLSLTGPPLGPPENPCELHCRPSDGHFAEKLRDAVLDGTPCYQGQTSRDLCVNGICKVCLREQVSNAAPPPGTLPRLHSGLLPLSLHGGLLVPTAAHGSSSRR